MRFLSKEESWELLREKVFGEESLCPPLLKNAGKKIAECCEGLPLTIVTVGELLSKVKRTPDYNYLPQYLKASFLYMGVFPRNYEISLSELFKLWVAEKFPYIGVDRLGVCSIIEDLFHDSLLMELRSRSSYGIKTWSIHSSFWHLCKREALKNKFSYVIQWFGGPPHQYPVSICFNLKLLRILNALTIRLYEFPMDVLKLFQLKYLALWNLEILIVCRHISIGSSRAPSYLPIEIWDMKELKHLQVMGSDLPDPCEGTFLPNLQTLLDVSARSCNKCVFQGTPNLNKLGIRIELTPDGHVAETMRCFDHIHYLQKLESLKCVVVNPTFGPHIAPPPLPIFPSSLKKLSLSGFGYPWEDMRLIASLPNLETLKLRCYAFRGPKLEIKDNGFPKLRFLLIEDTDLVNWTVELGSLPELLDNLLKSCYKLENIIYDNRSGQPGHVSTELVNCYMLENVHKPRFALNN
ncbi:putative late blight resistance protein homolog r1b-8 [Phtheirospermum japonicum]|uniref:Putative late blight resistance protein homolog r1b-8 n=1 Tax=Phtheirospermum japonicum TaxID=374723 RepID=A0A830BFN7_9LAMI|nr:putative late blight resistance protein homolog r1b-8 [Phtheirospermum japonicum]